jgi:predicted ester cyclase
MSYEENSRCMNRWLHAIDSGDEAEVGALIDELASDDYVLHTGGSTLSDPNDVKGREGLREHVRTAYKIFGNMQRLVEDEFGDDDRLATRVRFRAIHKGEFLGIAPTGRTIECSIIYITHFENGRFKECWLDWDSLLSVAAQLGKAAQSS